MPANYRWLFVLVGSLLAATACAPSGSNSNAAVPSADPDAGSGDKTVQTPLTDSLVVYSGRSESLIGGMIDSFESETGIDVAVRWGESGELAATLLEEGSSTAADVFLAQDPGALGAVESMFAPLPDVITGRVPANIRPDSALWAPITGRARAVVYNTENVLEPSLPAGLEGFTDPTWKGRVGWAPTNASFQAMVTAMRVLWGDDRARDWLLAMLANDVAVYDGNGPIVAAVGAGEIDVGLVNHYYLYRFLKEEGEGFKARNHYMRDGGPGSMVLVSGAGILKGAAHPEAAAQFVSYLLADTTQERFVAETHEYPAAIGVAASSDLPPMAELDSPDLAVADLADLAGTVDLLRNTGALP